MNAYLHYDSIDPLELFHLSGVPRIGHKVASSPQVITRGHTPRNPPNTGTKFPCSFSCSSERVPQHILLHPSATLARSKLTVESSLFPLKILVQTVGPLPNGSNVEGQGVGLLRSRGDGEWMPLEIGNTWHVQVNIVPGFEVEIWRTFDDQVDNF